MISDEWPHQFTRLGSSHQAGDGSIWNDMICVHCQVEYVQGRDSPPTNPCPARNTKRELKRLKG